MARAPIHILSILIALGFLSGAGTAGAQQYELHPQSVRATREQLEELRLHYDAAARSRAYSDELRALARSRAEAVRQRLEEGDFRPGDWVVMELEGEPALSDTFLVTRDQAVELPLVGTVALRGALRSELETRLADQIGRYINNPVVRARSYMRVSVIGEVSSPGYYLMPAETPVGEAIMLAGGPTTTAKLSKVKIHRGTDKILEGESMQLAIREARTLAELNLQDGDQITVPRRSAFAPGGIGQTLVIVSSLLFTLNAIF